MEPSSLDILWNEETFRVELRAERDALELERMLGEGNPNNQGLD